LLKPNSSDSLFELNPTAFNPKQESGSGYCMQQFVTSVSEAGKTVMLISHGGRVTHLYEELTGKPWHVHGESTYCFYSVYKKGSNGRWEPVQVNNSK
jgi:hypothetical protein